MPIPQSPSLTLSEMNRRGLQGIVPGLSRIQAVCAALGHPERRLGQVVHVAGTNGKGSVCAFLEAIGLASNRRTALFTSPHLVRVTERVRLNGQDISLLDLDRATRAVLAAEAETGVLLTGFELITAAGFQAMAEFQPAVSIVEVGMGGRLDATNVVVPTVTVITPVALDHMAYLGASLAAVAREKAGIIKAGVPCIIATQESAALAEIVSRAESLGSPLVRVDDEVVVAGSDRCWSARCQELRVGPVALGLAGTFQSRNAALSLRAAMALLGTDLSPLNAAAGLAQARWPGRFQLVSLGGREIVLDGGHNPHGLTAFMTAFRDRYSHRPDVLFALKDDKDAAGMGALLADFAGWVVCTRAGESASVAPEHLAQHLEGVPVVVEPDLDRALPLLVARKGNNVAVCCGSLYLVGALLARMESSGAQPTRRIDEAT